MEAGILTDSTGRKVDFRNTLLVMTSNLGGHGGSRGGLGFGASGEDLTLRALRERSLPEFFGRIDYVATFRSLGIQELQENAGF